MNWLKRRIAYARSTNGTMISDRGALRYTTGIISDSHLTYTNGAAHFEAALNNLYALDADCIISCGDPTVNGTESEWTQYLTAIDASPFNRADIYECIGNHELYSGVSDGIARFKQYSNNGALASASVPYFAQTIQGDRYIFLALEAGQYPNSVDEFTTAQLDWLEEELDGYVGTGNIWIVEHSLFQGWGSGDNPTYPGYGGALQTTSSFPGNARLKSILTAHPDVIMLHGHSHIRLQDRDTYGLVVYAPPSDGGCHQIHVPSISAQKYFNGAGSLAVDWSLGASQCWLCKVYENVVVFQGLNAYSGQEIDGQNYEIII